MSDSAQLRVLVLGVGGNVSQGILKGLSVSALQTSVIAGCIEPTSLGLYRADLALISPRADDPGFAGWLRELCAEEAIDAVLSGVEPVLEAISSDEGSLRELGAVPIVSPPGVLEIGRDKLNTCHWLAERGLAFPRFADAAAAGDVANLVAECGFPLIAKPRRGKGSLGVRTIHDQAELEPLIGETGLILQEELADEGGEYTAGCFCDADGILRGTIVMRRTLEEGTTHTAEVGEFADVREAVEAIVRELRPLGPCNVQLRLRDEIPVPFEINVRFSGTTPMRARLGFNEVEAALRHFVMGEPAENLPEVKAGIVVRYWNEMYIDPGAAEEMARTGRRETPASGARIEDWGMLS